MESIAIGKNLAATNGYEIDATQEMLALGIANVVGARGSQGLPGSGNLRCWGSLGIWGSSTMGQRNSPNIWMILDDHIWHCLDPEMGGPKNPEMEQNPSKHTADDIWYDQWYFG